VEGEVARPIDLAGPRPESLSPGDARELALAVRYTSAMTTIRILIALAFVFITIPGCRSGEKTSAAEASGNATQPSAAEPAANPAAPLADAAPAWYENEIRAFEAADAVSPPEPGQILFTGSSSVRMWTTLAEDMAPMPVLNRGFGGSKTNEVLAVFDRIVVPYEPSVIVYYCGDNDLGNDNTDFAAAANGFIAFDKRARALWPKVEVLYIAIKPSIARWNNWDAMRKANAMVADYCAATPGATYLDIATPVLGPDGPDPTIFLDDGLHLNAKGYAIWTEVMRPQILAAWERTRD